MNAMKKLATIPSLVALAVALAYGSSPALAVPVTLGPTLSTFAVLGGTSVTNALASIGSNATVITGNLGACLLNALGTGCTGIASITGFDTDPLVNTVILGGSASVTDGPGLVNGGAIHAGTTTGTPNALAAAVELKTLYTTLDLLASGLVTTVGGGLLSGTSRAAGVYTVASTGAATDLAAGSTLTLTGTIGADQFVFLMSAGLHTGAGSKVDVSGLGAGDSVYWLVRESAAFDANTEFAGTIAALTAITFAAGATNVCGKALARNAEVTFAGVGTVSGIPNQVGGGCEESGGLTGEITAPVPEPEIYAMMGMGLGLMGWVARRRKQKAA